MSLCPIARNVVDSREDFLDGAKRVAKLGAGEICVSADIVAAVTYLVIAALTVSILLDCVVLLWTRL